MRSSLLVAALALPVLMAAPAPADAFMRHSGHHMAFRVHHFHNAHRFFFTRNGFFFVSNGHTFFRRFPNRFNRFGTSFAESFGSFDNPFVGSAMPFGAFDGGAFDGFASGIDGSGVPTIVAVPAGEAFARERREAGFTVEKTQGVTVIRGPGSHHAAH